MSLTFNIADLHGRVDLLNMALDKINQYKTLTKEDVIVFTGDYIDRGPDSKQVIEKIMSLQKGSIPKVIALLGNHETFMVDAANKVESPIWVYMNGGKQTLESYNNYSDIPAGTFPKEHIKWINRLHRYYDDGKRVYVHAFMDVDKDIHDQDFDSMIWDLYPERGLENKPFYLDGYDKEYRYVVHGHHQFIDGPVILDCRANFDTLAWLTGRLVIGVFDNDKVGPPIDTIEVIGPNKFNKENTL